MMITQTCRRFGGYPMTHNHWEQEMKALEADLVYDRHKYQPGQYYTAGYDHPWKFHNRLVLNYKRISRDNYSI